MRLNDIKAGMKVRVRHKAALRPAKVEIVRTDGKVQVNFKDQRGGRKVVMPNLVYPARVTD